MNCSRLIALFAVVALAGFHSQSCQADNQATQQNQTPNIIFILCDDLGWGDLGILHQNQSTHDKKFATPQLDAMAQQGVQLRQHYCPAPVCAPSRASLLLGVHQGHCGIRDNQFDKELPDNHNLASMLKTAGYTTALIGKYGLQGNRAKDQQNSNDPRAWPAYPTTRGFDEFFGYVRHVDGHIHYPAHQWELGNSQSHQTPKELWHNDREISAQLQKCYTTDLFTAYAKHWIQQQVDQTPNKPFFLYLAYDTPHAALQVPTGPYPEGRGIKGGVQWTGKPGEMINTATGEIDSFRYPEFTNQGWSDVEERFATMVRRIDDSVGDLLQTLQDLKIDQNTLVVLSSDNGPHHESYLKADYDPTSFQSYGPFDGTKRDCWEGGIRVPTLAYWPGKIPAGHVDATPSQFHDWMATFADVAGIAPPARCDGVTLIPSMTGTGDREPSQVYVEYWQNGRTRSYDDFEEPKRGRKRGQMQVLLHNGYKGVRFNIDNPNQPFEIYKLEDDPSESNNLADTSDDMRRLQDSMQRQVLQMRRADDGAKRPYDALPVPGSDYSTADGLFLRKYPGEFAFVPKASQIRSKTTPDARLIKDPTQPVQVETGALVWDGLIRIDQEGEYTFEWQCDQPAVIRIHDAVLIDDDFAHQPDKAQESTIRLAAGLHEIEITMLCDQQSPNWKLSATQGNSGEDVLQNRWFVVATGN